MYTSEYHAGHPVNFFAGSLHGGDQKSFSHIGRSSQMGQGLTLAQKCHEAFTHKLLTLRSTRF